MGEKTDVAAGRAKQAAGAITGDEERKREGQRQEDRGTAKGKIDDVIDRAHEALDTLKHKVDRS